MAPRAPKSSCSKPAASEEVSVSSIAPRKKRRTGYTRRRRYPSISPPPDYSSIREELAAKFGPRNPATDIPPWQENVQPRWMEDRPRRHRYRSVGEDESFMELCRLRRSMMGPIPRASDLAASCTPTTISDLAARSSEPAERPGQDPLHPVDSSIGHGQQPAVAPRADARSADVRHAGLDGASRRISPGEVETQQYPAVTQDASSQPADDRSASATTSWRDSIVADLQSRKQVCDKVLSSVEGHRQQKQILIDTYESSHPGKISANCKRASTLEYTDNEGRKHAMPLHTASWEDTLVKHTEPKLGSSIPHQTYDQLRKPASEYAKVFNDFRHNAMRKTIRDFADCPEQVYLTVGLRTDTSIASGDGDSIADPRVAWVEASAGLVDNEELLQPALDFLEAYFTKGKQLRASYTRDTTTPGGTISVLEHKRKMHELEQRYQESEQRLRELQHQLAESSRTGASSASIDTGGSASRGNRGRAVRNHKSAARNHRRAARNYERAGQGDTGVRRTLREKKSSSPLRQRSCMLIGLDNDVVDGT
ncbi:uncharacterized protein L969DRAFT_42343 [Mixia osmundae IAM 14324]|uniref:Uncharacterized protein n=1 Tax=Mixia osmundae (strain CBS 9802 / IAM 14324 / JCM 22182 / KY 12970) TaxID=764103 RepID=G7EAE8_MIXOS|nr:uncharacterized protein L969DRAFT_42343 [Mixia osmundae IAM 14324]KEI42298.1 hypothetical protein L969DRAFT_42343 [Mixia osmundae IAM 14324]GAA99808.1 hypothetical protein E5Q_06511 [Mixia osmundae IAM 14324]